jgi:hypothetical protein
VQLIIVAVSRRAPPLPCRRGIQHGASSLGPGTAGRVVGPREGSRSLSIPLDLEEPGGDGIFPCVFPSPAAGGFPEKTSRKRMARGIQKTDAGGLTGSINTWCRMANGLKPSDYKSLGSISGLRFPHGSKIFRI